MHCYAGFEFLIRSIYCTSYTSFHIRPGISSLPCNNSLSSHVRYTRFPLSRSPRRSFRVRTVRSHCQHPRVRPGPSSCPPPSSLSHAPCSVSKLKSIGLIPAVDLMSSSLPRPVICVVLPCGCLLTLFDPQLIRHSEDLGYQNSTSTTWNVTLAAGTQVVLYVADSEGNDAWSGTVRF